MRCISACFVGFDVFYVGWILRIPVAVCCIVIWVLR
jgi:hypothetical protein